MRGEPPPRRSPAESSYPAAPSVAVVERRGPRVVVASDGPPVDRHSLGETDRLRERERERKGEAPKRGGEEARVGEVVDRPLTKKRGLIATRGLAARTR